MNILIFENLQLEGLYVADLLSYKALTSSLVSIHHHTVDPFTQFVHTTSPLVTINLLSVSKSLRFLLLFFWGFFFFNFSYKIDHMLIVFFCLTYVI